MTDDENNFPDGSYQHEVAIGLASIDKAKAITEELDPDAAQVIGAAYRNSALLGSALSSHTLWNDLSMDDSPELSPEMVLEKVRETGFDDYLDLFTSVRTQGDFDALTSDIRREVEDREILQAAGAWGTVASMGSAILDVPSLIPIGRLAQVSRSAATGRAALLNTVSAAALDNTIRNVGLYASQKTRTAEETVTGIAADTVIGSALGFGLYKAFSSKTAKKVSQRFDQSRDELAALAPYNETTAGGRSDRVFDMGAFGIPLKVGRTPGMGWFRQPAAELMDGASAAEREIAQGMGYTTPILQSQAEGAKFDNATNSVGFESPQNVYGIMSQFMGRSEDIANDVRTTWEKKKSAFNGDEDAFQLELHKAVVTGDNHVDPDIQKIARRARNEVLDPIRREMVAQGVFQDDKALTTAFSYFPRLWDARTIVAKEAEFKEWLKPVFERELDENVFAQRTEYNRRSIERDKIVGQRDEALRAQTSVIDKERADSIKTLQETQRQKLEAHDTKTREELAKVEDDFKTKEAAINDEYDQLVEDAKTTKANLDDQLKAQGDVDPKTAIEASRKDEIAAFDKGSPTLEPKLEKLFRERDKAIAAGRDTLKIRDKVTAYFDKLAKSADEVSPEKQSILDRYEKDLADIEKERKKALAKLNGRKGQNMARAVRAKAKELDAERVTIKADQQSLIDKANEAANKAKAEAEAKVNEQYVIPTTAQLRSGLDDLRWYNKSPEEKLAEINERVDHTYLAISNADVRTFNHEVKSRGAASGYRKARAIPVADLEALKTPYVVKDFNDTLHTYARKAGYDVAAGKVFKTKGPAIEVKSEGEDLTGKRGAPDAQLMTKRGLTELAPEDVAKLHEQSPEIKAITDRAEVMGTPIHFVSVAAERKSNALAWFDPNQNRVFVDVDAVRSQKHFTMREVVQHEYLHALRYNKKISANEWAALVRAAGRERMPNGVSVRQHVEASYGPSYRKAGLRGNQYNEYLNEEIVAHVFQRETMDMNARDANDAINRLLDPQKPVLPSFMVQQKDIPDIGLKSKIKEITDHYQQLIEGYSPSADTVTKVDKLTDPIAREELLGRAKVEETDRLKAQAARAVENAQLMAGFVRGDQAGLGTSTGVREAATAVGYLNHMRLNLGTLVYAPIDTLNVFMANGFKSTVQNGVIPMVTKWRDLVRNMDTATQRQARLELSNLEMMHSALVAQELNTLSPYERGGSGLVRGMRTLSDTLTKWSGLQYVNHVVRTLARNTLHGTVMEMAERGWGQLAKHERTRLLNNGINGEALERIRRSWADQAAPKRIDGTELRFGDYDNWPDHEAAEHVRRFVMQESNNMVVTPTVFDKRKVDANPVAQLVLGMRRTLLASQGRVMGRQVAMAASDPDSGKRLAVAGWFAAMLTMGAAIDGFKEVLRLEGVTGSKDKKGGGADRFIEHWQKAPGDALYSAIDRSGSFLPMAMEMNNIAEKLQMPGIRTGLSLIAGDDQKHVTGPARFKSRSAFETLLGPSAGLVEAVPRGVDALSNALPGGDQFSRSDFRVLRTLMPGSTILYMQPVINELEKSMGGYLDWPDPK